MKWNFFIIIGLNSLFFLSGHLLYGQELKKMTPADYDRWYKIKNQAIAASGKTVIYTLEKETGDKILGIYDAEADTSYFYPRSQSASMDPTGHFVVFTRSLSYDSTRTLKRKKTPKDKMPSDSLVIFDKRNATTTTIARASDAKLSEKWPGYCFYLVKEEEKKEITPEKKDSTSTEKPKKKQKPVCDQHHLIIRKLDTGKEDTIRRVSEYTIARDKAVMACASCVGDSIARFQIVLKDLLNDSVRIVADSLAEAAKLNLSHDGGKLAYLSLAKKADGSKKPYSLSLFVSGEEAVRDLSLRKEAFTPSGWLVSGDKKPSFSESGERLFFGVAPVLPEKDTNKLDEDIARVEIWHYDSPRLYTQMETTEDADRKKSYTILYSVSKDTFITVENQDTDRSLVGLKGDGKYALTWRTSPYEKAVTWLGETKKDLFLLDLESGISTQFGTAESGNPAFSPAGKYIYWWSRQDSIWKTFHTEKKTLGVLGLWSVSNFKDEENDVPEKAGPYGLAGWLENDTAAIVYDRYDLWKLNPEDPFSNICMTDGRMHKHVFRWIDTDRSRDYIDTSDVLLLHRFNEDNKGEAYYSYTMAGGKIEKLTGGDYSLTKSVLKADSTNACVFYRQSFDVFPDILLSTLQFDSITRITNANPQQKEYAWGSTKLFSWTNYRGLKNDGLLILPPNFDPDKEYPLLVNFYERSSDELYRHRAPEANRSSINYAYYANQGFVIFNPDIKYLTGQPGEDCYNAVESGVEALIKLRFIDRDRIGLQGHSWGGYQVAYLLTRSERYRCAEAGAPVVNMVSAYGGIRWESGMSRMFQYEKQQSRLGATLWDNPQLYHTNSPLYNLPKVTTPVLILHNDEDGAVPWVQGIEYYMALRRLGKPAWLLNYNGEPHWPVKWPNRLDFNIRMEQFFKHYLMDEPMPLWMKEGNSPLEKGILDKY